MYSNQLNFAPDENHLRFTKQREEYVNKLKAYQVAPENKKAEETHSVKEEAEEQSKAGALPFKTSDLVLIGAVIMLLLDGDNTQDTVLLGILIYLLLG